MYLLLAGITERTNPRRARHVHPGHELLVVASGEGSQLGARGEEPCSSGDIFVFPAGIPHMSYAGPGKAFTCLVVQHDPGDFADVSPGDGGEQILAGIAGRALRDHRLRVRPATSTRTIALLDRALAEWRSDAAGGRCLARALVMEALVQIGRDQQLGLVPADPDASATRHIESACSYLDQYWMQPVRIDDLVALGPLGRSQLLARFKAATGQTVGQRLLEARLREARRMLRAGGTTMLDIALASGFGSQSHFNHQFRRVHGCSPRAWRGAGRREA